MHVALLAKRVFEDVDCQKFPSVPKAEYSVGGKAPELLTVRPSLNTYNITPLDLLHLRRGIMQVLEHRLNASCSPCKTSF